MIFLQDYKYAAGKTIKEVREYVDASFDDQAEFTLIVFTDDTALLIVHQSYFTTTSGVIQPDSKMLDKKARKALYL